ncbi:MAG: PDGLE domain-containing protein [Dehalococcoidia bacterium]|nr:PDGLE domain-containing protein [Dehalococcoidia bacterium]
MTAAPSRPSFLRRYRWVLVGLAAAVLVVLIFAPRASSDPDGLDRVAGDKGFEHQAEHNRFEWLPDYSVPGVDNETASVILAGLIGVGVVFLLPMAIGAALRSSRKARS